MTGKVHSFQSLGTLDGPGVRFVAFMHGCNLHCGYCHNVDVCRGEYVSYTPEEIFKRVTRYKEYFSDDGGITVSGGEPLLQAEFLKELFKLCKQDEINTAIDTSGSIWNDDVSELLELTDLVLLDIKMTNDENYQKYIGCSLSLPMNFLEKIKEKGKKCWIRYVVVEGLNDSDDDIVKLKNIISRYDFIEKVELLPFKKVCKTKYDAMGLDFPFDIYPETSKKTIDRLYGILNEI